MSKKSKMSIVSVLFFLVATACVADASRIERQGQPKATNYEGHLRIFHHSSVFVNRDQKHYRLKMLNEDGQKRLSAIVRKHNYGSVSALCINATINGHLLGDLDEMNRLIISVVEVVSLKETECSET